jgi:hypothetical protein
MVRELGSERTGTPCKDGFPSNDKNLLGLAARKISRDLKRVNAHFVTAADHPVLQSKGELLPCRLRQAGADAEEGGDEGTARQASSAGTFRFQECMALAVARAIQCDS